MASKAPHASPSGEPGHEVVRDVDHLGRLGLAISRIEDPFFCEGKVSEGDAPRDVHCAASQGSPAVGFPVAQMSNMRKCLCVLSAERASGSVT